MSGKFNIRFHAKTQSRAKYAKWQHSQDANAANRYSDLMNFKAAEFMQ